MKYESGKCHICRDVYTINHVVTSYETVIFICTQCIEKAKDNFIWLCMSCGKAYMNPKELVISRIKDHELKKAYMLCKDSQMIQGIEECIACTPERIVDFLETLEAGMDC